MEFEFVETARPKLRRRPPKPRERHFECANCGNNFTALTTRDTAYCSPKCDTTAKAVRYGRAKLQESGSLQALPDDIKLALRYKVAHALGAGYDDTARTIPDETRQLVRERDGGRCVLCGAVGEEIDHIDGDSNDVSNLRLLCKSCHHEVTDAHLQPITDAATRSYRDEILLRMHSPEPLKVCDAPEWSTGWRAWVREHETTP